MLNLSYIILSVILVIGLTIPNIFNVHAQEEDNYQRHYYNDEGYQSNYDNNDYYQHPPETPKLKITKELFVCTAEDKFCNTDELVECSADPEKCSTLGISESDFQIDILHSIKGSSEGVDFNFDSNQYRVTENFKLSSLGEALCFFNDLDFDSGGILKTASDKIAFVCNQFEGDCNGKIEYGETKECNIKNYVFAILPDPINIPPNEITGLLNILNNKVTN